MAQEDRTGTHFVRVCRLADVQAAGCLTVHVEGHTLALFARSDEVHAVDNRCPHMGFPLDRGTVKDGILTCHWHHARFELESGATFDGTKFTWLGSVTNEVSTCVTWHTSPVKTWNDILTREIAMGGEGPGADPDVYTLLSPYSRHTPLI